MLSSIFLSASLATLALARTDLVGCTTTDVSSPAGASVAWYVPGTGEICAFIDCGGGAGAPVTTNPGCPLYSGTATYSPSYLPGFSKATPVPQSASVASDSSSSAWAATTSAPGSSEVSMTAASSQSTAAVSTSAIIDTIITSMTAASSATSAAPASQSTAGGNGTVSTASPTLSHSLSGAVPTAQAWMGGAGLLMGLGAVVAAL